jgi:hypothetical protein
MKAFWWLWAKGGGILLGIRQSLFLLDLTWPEILPSWTGIRTSARGLLRRMSKPLRYEAIHTEDCVSAGISRLSGIRILKIKEASHGWFENNLEENKEEMKRFGPRVDYIWATSTLPPMLCQQSIQCWEVVHVSLMEYSCASYVSIDFLPKEATISQRLLAEQVPS